MRCVRAVWKEEMSKEDNFFLEMELISFILFMNHHPAP